MRVNVGILILVGTFSVLGNVIEVAGSTVCVVQKDLRVKKFFFVRCIFEKTYRLFPRPVAAAANSVLPLEAHPNEPSFGSRTKRTPQQKTDHILCRAMFVAYDFALHCH